MEPDIFDDRLHKETFQEGMLVLYHGQEFNRGFLLELVNGLYQILIGQIVKFMIVFQ